jgi:hypothetical protein
MLILNKMKEINACSSSSQENEGEEDGDMVMNILPGLNFPGPKDAEDKSKDHQSD